ncbi:MAG: exodeoxyribonuclease III [Planctomycetota bacterium]
MRIVTWNVNGMRAGLRKGALEKLDEIGADVVLLQEVRAMWADVGEAIESAGWLGGEATQEGVVGWNPAIKKGYAGTAVLWREHIEAIGLVRGLGARDRDHEGRVLSGWVRDTRVKGSKKWVGVSSVYLPSGSSGTHRQTVKESWMKRFRPWAGKRQQAASHGVTPWPTNKPPKAVPPVVLGGDFNIAMTPADIFYDKSNEDRSGYLPHERAWMTRLVGSGWSDLVREAYGEVEGPYTWWSNRGQARKLDRGWRIDYLLANASAAERVADGSVKVHRDASLGVSDHAPVALDLD